MRPEVGVCHLTGVRLMHQVNIHRGFEDLRGQIYLAKLLSLQIQNIYFHV
jgi:hypothetical protein